MRNYYCEKIAEIENATKSSYSNENSKLNEKNSKLTAHGYSRQRETLRIINRVFYRKELGMSRCDYHINIETKNECMLLQHARNVDFTNVNTKQKSAIYIRIVKDDL